MFRALKFTFFLFLFSANFIALGQNISSEADSLQILTEFAKSDKYTWKERTNFAKRLVQLSNNTKNDSLILKANRVLSRVYLLSGNYNPFVTINHTNIALAEKLKDTFASAIAHQNLGYYHHYIDTKYDSAYFYYNKAIKEYEKLDNKASVAEVLFSIADIQESEKDYVGSEENAIRAVKILVKLPESKNTIYKLWSLHNLLGIIALELKLNEKSLEYHEKALTFCDKMDDGVLNRLTSLNNIAYLYKQTEQYQKALDIYNDIIVNNELFDLDPTFYALIIDNIAFMEFKLGSQDDNRLLNMFQRAYKISDSLDDPITKMGVTIDLSKFYQDREIIDSALHYANETYKLAKEHTTNDILLEAMLVLADLNKGNKGKEYLLEHIQLNDSLLTNERSIRNKFARIEFETDEIERENERISRERMWLMGLSGVLIITLILLYIIISQRARNKELKLIQQQQEANEEIYNLMLSQQDKIDEARTVEKSRISQELHDGVLGRLFGTRLSLDSLNMNSNEEAVKTRGKYIDELKTIEDDIRKVSHDLSSDFVSGSGFIDIIETLVETQTKAYQLEFDLKHDDHIHWDGVTNKTKIHIYRIIQETLQNIYKHAQATHVKISFELKNNVICVTIADNGSGFDVNKARRGIGIKNITSRVNEIQGELHIDSKKDLGTSLTIHVPM